MKKLVLGALFLSFSLVLTSCGPKVKVVNSWSDDSLSNYSIDSVLVIGVARSDLTRKMFDDSFVEAFAEKNVRAIPGYKFIPLEKHEFPDREVVKKIIRDSGTKSVLITRVIDKKTETNVSGGGIYSVYNPSPNSYSMYDYYGYSISYIPPTEIVDDILYMESNLYDIANNKLLWSVQTKVVNPVKAKKEFQQFVKALMDDLYKVDKK